MAARQPEAAVGQLEVNRLTGPTCALASSRVPDQEPWRLTPAVLSGLARSKLGVLLAPEVVQRLLDGVVRAFGQDAVIPPAATLCDM